MAAGKCAKCLIGTDRFASGRTHLGAIFSSALLPCYVFLHNWFPLWPCLPEPSISTTMICISTVKLVKTMCACRHSATLLRSGFAFAFTKMIQYLLFREKCTRSLSFQKIERERNPSLTLVAATAAACASVDVTRYGWSHSLIA